MTKSKGVINVEKLDKSEPSPLKGETVLSERVGNNWFREIGLTAPCSNSATISVNGQFYGLYVAEEGITKSLLTQFFPGNADGDPLSVQIGILRIVEGKRRRA